MNLETRYTLSDATLTKLQTLIQYNIDSSDGFCEAAHQVGERRLAEMFRDLSVERARLANELRAHMEGNGKTADDQGSLAASAHRTLIHLRSAISGGDPYVILAEAERGEDYIKGAYEVALDDCAGTAVNDVLHAHYALIKASHDRVRDLRDGYRNRE